MGQASVHWVVAMWAARVWLIAMAMSQGEVLRNGAGGIANKLCKENFAINFALVKLKKGYDFLKPSNYR